ncbi:hypothetical protein X975_04943, partial [Stegodyphus mimosarum]
MSAKKRRVVDESRRYSEEWEGKYFCHSKHNVLFNLPRDHRII